MFRKSLLALLTCCVVVGGTACSEKLEAGNVCVSDPTLCPGGSISLRDTVLDAVAFDTTITGLPPIGVEDYMLLAYHGDTLDTRIIVRYDTLTTTYVTKAGDSTIARADSAYLKLLIQVPDSVHRPTGPITINIYDVDTVGTDTSAAILTSLFRADRFLGSTTFAPESLTDTLRVRINGDSVVDKITKGKALRVGLQMTGGHGDLLIASTNKWAGTTLSFRPSPDTAVARVNVTPLSRTPTNQSFLAGPLADYVVIAAGAVPAMPTFVSVGGEPSRRAYLRFDVPSVIVDSSTIVRATLLLIQAPNRYGADRLDTVRVIPAAVTVSPEVTSYFTALQFLSAEGSFGLFGKTMTPADSGLREMDIVGLVRTWRGISTTMNPRVIGLRSGQESMSGAEVDFYSTRAPLAVRPRLRITYVPRTSFGVP